MKAFAGILGLFVTLPIWYYLLYKVLQMVGATELMWFLYWIYVPAGFLVAALTRAAESK